MALSAALGLVFSVITAAVLRPAAAIPAAVLFTAVSCVFIGVDLGRRELSHRVLALAIAGVLVAQGVAAWSVDAPIRWAGSLAGGGVAFVAVLAFHLVSPESPTRTEVAYAALVGTTLGWFGLGRVGLGLGLGLVIGAVTAGPLVLVGRRRVDAGVIERPEVASIVPALAMGGWVALCWGEAILNWYTATRA